jgi:isoleucyl-tRNA synthetase
VRMSENVMNQLSEAYRKLRNTFRFALSNLADFDPANDAVPDARLLEMDAWMIERAGKLVRQCREWYEQFQFHRVFHALHDFCIVDLSAFYFDVLKDRLYTFAPRSVGRRSAQTAIYRIASALTRLAAPIMAFTAEEVWKHLPHEPADPESVHLAVFPAGEGFETGLPAATLNTWERLLALRSEVLSALERARQEKRIAGSLEAKVVLHADGDLGRLVERYRSSLPALFIVSQVEMVPNSRPQGSGGAAAKVTVERADGAKCERCWNYSTLVGSSADYPTLCERCLAALEEIERSGHASDRSANS